MLHNIQNIAYILWLDHFFFLPITFYQILSRSMMFPPYYPALWSMFQPSPGMEAVGVVTAVGPGLTGRKVGDVVAYAGKPMGSYAQEQILPANVAVPVPSSIDHKTAAAIMLKGMTVHVLVRRVFKVYSGLLLCYLRFMDLSLDE
jgi:NADPH:quinone reductase-like Zn-dependent oxidoreductase